MIVCVSVDLDIQIVHSPVYAVETAIVTAQALIDAIEALHSGATKLGNFRS